MTNHDEVKVKFYEDMHCHLNSTPKQDKLVILGDFNARVGADNNTWSQVMGKHGSGNCNCNGLLLLQMCSEHLQIVLTNTLFQLPNTSMLETMASPSNLLVDHREIKSPNA